MSEKISLIFSVISLLFGSGVLLAVVKPIAARIKANDARTEAVCLGVQAMLRNDMIQLYNKYVEQGYAPIYAKQNFENMWRQYHNLGANGVMDDIHEKFLELPTQKVE